MYSIKAFLALAFELSAAPVFAPSCFSLVDNVICCCPADEVEGIIFELLCQDVVSI